MAACAGATEIWCSAVRHGGCAERPCTAGALLHAALNGLGAGHAGWRAGPPGWATLNLTPESNRARAPRSPGWVTWIICSRKRTTVYSTPAVIPNCTVVGVGVVGGCWWWRWVRWGLRAGRKALAAHCRTCLAQHLQPAGDPAEQGAPLAAQHAAPEVHTACGMEEREGGECVGGGGVGGGHVGVRPPSQSGQPRTELVEREDSGEAHRTHPPTRSLSSKASVSPEVGSAEQISASESAMVKVKNTIRGQPHTGMTGPP